MKVTERAAKIRVGAKSGVGALVTLSWGVGPLVMGKQVAEVDESSVLFSDPPVLLGARGFRHLA
jgi:hypothetical protein